MLKRLFPAIALTALLLAGCGGTSATPEASDAGPTSDADLTAVKTYLVDHVAQMKAATSDLRATAQGYYDLSAESDFDYERAWADHGEELADLLTQAKEQWSEASLHYEASEGLVAGVPSLAYYDVWIDAGPSGEEDPEAALDWQLELPDGRALDRPGNFFHNLTEPAIWGTVDTFVGLRVDLDGDGEVEPGEALPEANLFLASASGLDDATAEMSEAVDAWEPNLEDAFTALVVMIPTMNEYFEQWKLSTFVIGEESTEISFVALSRLFDINGILGGLNLTYDTLGPLVAEEDPALHQQISSEMDALVAYVDDLYQQEAGGKRFTAEEADLFGTEAQNRAVALVGQVSQAAALLDVQVQE